MKPFTVRKTELSVQDGCLLWGNRVIVPQQGRKQLLQELHEGHPGIARMKSRARMFFWWPGMDKDIEARVKLCTDCQSIRPTPAPAPLHPWEWPSQPWSRIHVDYAGPYQGRMLLVLSDAHSKWMEVHALTSATSSATIQSLRSTFAQLGLPRTVVTDNGPCIVSAEFKEFMQKNGIRHITSSPYHPSTNGLAEKAVQTLKQGLKKMREGTLTDRISRFLFSYRTTPHSTTKCTPAELLFGRNLRSRFHLLKPDLAARVEEKQDQQKKAHDQGAVNRSFEIGEPVYVRNYAQGPKWLAGHIQKCTGPVSFMVSLEGSASVWRRHQDQLRKRLVKHTPVVDIDDPDLPLPSMTEKAPPTLPIAQSVPSPVPESTTASESNSSEPMSPSSPSPPLSNSNDPAAPSNSNKPVAPVQPRYPKRDRRPPDRFGVNLS